jgi:hypothetical protein
LENDLRDWRWWWWINNPWWEEKCIICEILGFHYDKLIEEYDQERRNLLG